MKKLIIILFLFPILVIGQENHWKLQPDKIYHISAGALITEEGVSKANKE